MRIVPSNTGGFGAADTAGEVFGDNEIKLLQRRFAQPNNWIGDELRAAGHPSDARGLV